MPSTQEWATLILISPLIGLALSVRSIRNSIPPLLRLLVSRAILIGLTTLVLWVGGEVLLAKRLGLWNPSMVTSSLFWFAGTGLVLFMGAVDAGKDPEFFRKLVRRSAGVAVFLGVLFGLSSLPLPVEVVAQLLVTVCACMAIVGQSMAGAEAAVRVTNGVALLVSGCLVVYGIVGAVRQTTDGRATHLLEQFALPIWLTIGLVPYVYLLGCVAEYQLMFARVEFGDQKMWKRRLALVLTFRGSLHALNSFSGFQSVLGDTSMTLAEFRRRIESIVQSQSQDD
jgi:hypothetical protein